MGVKNGLVVSKDSTDATVAASQKEGGLTGITVCSGAATALDSTVRWSDLSEGTTSAIGEKGRGTVGAMMHWESREFESCSPAKRLLPLLRMPVLLHPHLPAADFEAPSCPAADDPDAPSDVTATYNHATNNLAVAFKAPATARSYTYKARLRTFVQASSMHCTPKTAPAAAGMLWSMITMGACPARSSLPIQCQAIMRLAPCAHCRLWM